MRGIAKLVLLLVVIAVGIVVIGETARRGLGLDLYPVAGAGVACIAVAIALFAPPIESIGKGHGSLPGFIGPAGMALALGLTVASATISGSAAFAISGTGMLVAYVTYLARSLERVTEKSAGQGEPPIPNGR